MYPASAAPQYVPGGSANAVICLLVGGLAIALRFVHEWENAKLERVEREGAADGGEEWVTNVTDGDRRPFGFRYVY